MAAAVRPLHAFDAVDSGRLFFRKYYCVVLQDKLAARQLPLTLVDQLEPTLGEYLTLADVYRRQGQEAWLTALRLQLEQTWDRHPVIYWWPWSELWR